MSEGFVIWVTGLPASGKTTISRLLRDMLLRDGINVQILESDELRKILTPKPTYSLEERDWFYSVIVYLAELLSKNGVNVIIDATGNKRRYRDEARRRLKYFMEVYLKCPLEVCMKRDVKGIYKLAIEGRSSTVPGIQDPYEEPIRPEVVVRTDLIKPEDVVKIIYDEIKRRFLVGRPGFEPGIARV